MDTSEEKWFFQEIQGVTLWCFLIVVFHADYGVLSESQRHAFLLWTACSQSISKDVWWNQNCSFSVDEGRSPREHDRRNCCKANALLSWWAQWGRESSGVITASPGFLFWVEMFNRKILSLCSCEIITATIAPRLAATAWLGVLVSRKKNMSRERED